MDSMRYLNAKFEVFLRCQIINQLRSCYLGSGSVVFWCSFTVGVSITRPLSFCTSLGVSCDRFAII